MYTLLLNENNELVTTVKERIMQRSKLVDDLHFLVDPIYKGHNMAEFTVMLEYLTPVSREYKTELLVKSDDLYKGQLEYKLPFDTCLTKEAGKIQVQLTFVKVDIDENGNDIQRVRKTSKAVVNIIPITAWSDIIADSALTALDQRLIQTQAMIEAANELSQYVYENKADNIVYNKEEQYIQLTANGTPIGNRITLDHGVCVKYIEIDLDNNLIVTYSDGTIKNLGKASSDAISGIYIPDVSEDGVMTMTLSKDVGKDVYTWDINPFNDWKEIDGIEGETTYAWEPL